MEVNNNIWKSPNDKNTHLAGAWLNRITLYTIPIMIACLCYINSLNGDFVHDDIFAIKDNSDVNGKNPVSAIWKNDFWGKPISHEASHKSYRPITTISFRINYELSGGKPFTFHIVNVVLHCTVTGLFMYVLYEILHITRDCSLYASLLFAVHPIHTEAVTGIVGRADILAAIFFILSIIFYVRSIKEEVYDEDNELPPTTKPWYLFGSIVCAIVATFCKEHGVMVLVVSAAVDYFIICKKGVNRIMFGESPVSLGEPLIKRIFLLMTTFLLVFIMRFIINGGQVPAFLEQDNPASFSPSFLKRVLTFNYLLAFNSWLLLAPITLCYDWQIGSIPLIDSYQDPRNIATVIFYIFLFLIIKRCLHVFKSEKSMQNIPVLSMILLIIPFIPATNIFLRVGFVVAERILYIPSLGFCLMVGYGFSQIITKYSTKKCFLLTIFTIYICLLASRTIHRNQVWKSRQSLFWSGVITLPHNAKVHYNYGNYLRDNDNIPEAISHYEEALRLYPAHASVHNNIGTLLTNQTQAEYHFKQALIYNTHHKGALVNLANIYHMQKNHKLAESLVNKSLKIDPSYYMALMLLSKIMMETGRNDEAKQHIETVIKSDPTSSDAHNYHGFHLHKAGKYDEAVSSYLTAYSLDSKALSSVTNAASTLRMLGRLTEAENLLKRALSVNPKVELKNQLGLLYFSTNHVPESLTLYENILEKAPNYTEAATNYAKILVSLDHIDNASIIIENVLNRSPDHVEALRVMASIHVKKGERRMAIEYFETALHKAHDSVNNNNLVSTICFYLGSLYQELKDLTTALKYFENVIKLDSEHSKAYLHVGGIHHINNNFPEARKYYNEALRLDPSNKLISSNLEKLGRLEKKARGGR